MLTLFVWYASEVLGKESMIKIQINFLEDIRYESLVKPLSSLASGNEELKLVFDGTSYFDDLQFSVYSPEEILCEKIRAVLTRKNVKARDFVDIFLICDTFGIKVPDIIENAISKTKFSLDMYDRYEDNLKERISALKEGDLFDWGDEKNLLLQDINEDKFLTFNKNLEKILGQDVLPRLVDV